MIEEKILPRVVEFRVEGEEGKKFVVYTIRMAGKSLVYRLYAHFLKIRKILCYRWPGIYIPYLSPKLKLTTLSEDFLEKRRGLLDEFVLKIAEVPYLFTSKEFESFLHTEMDIDISLTQFDGYNLEDLVTRYQRVFEELSGLEINTELIVKIVSFENYLKSALQNLKNFKVIAKNFTNTRDKLNNDYEKFMRVGLPNFEENCIDENLDKNSQKAIFLKDSLQEKIFFFQKEIQDNPYSNFITILSKEIREIKAFLETYKAKSFYEGHKKKIQDKQKEYKIEMQEALMGKTTIKSIFSRKTKAEFLLNLEQILSEINVELSGVSFICDIIIVLLGYIEIDRFKREKEAIYYSILKELSDKEFRYYKCVQEIWTNVLNDPLLLPYKYE